jgi:hypothetical protein
MATEPTTQTKSNGAKKAQTPDRKPRVISNPNDVADGTEARAARQGSRVCGLASIVLMQIDAVNSKKDDLTIAVKTLADTAKQLVRAYAGQAQAIQKLTQQVKELEAKHKSS